MKPRRWIAVSGIAILLLVAVCVVLRRPLLFAMGDALVSAGPPVKSDLVVVIGGDYLGNRILKGAELVREGYAPRVLVSGVGDLYGHSESELEIALAVAHGYPASMFIALPEPVLSTTEEAAADVAVMRHSGVHSYILVTSGFHTGRAGRVFRRSARDLDEHVVAAPDPYWRNGEWWTDREGRKEWFFESAKTIADFFRL